MFVFSSDSKVLIKFDGNTPKITIPFGVEVIGEDAFMSSDVEEVFLPSSIKRIDSEAFYNCKKLKSINLPCSLLYIGDNAFRGCESLNEINIPDTIQEMWGNAFQDCANLISLTLPSSLIVRDKLFFHGCKRLEYINIPESVAEIGELAFEFCSGLKYVIFHENIKYIRKHAFAHCESLSCITCYNFNRYNPNLNIDDYNKIKFFIVPLATSEIDDYAFYGCDMLRNIVLQNPQIKIGQNAFGSNSCNNKKNLFVRTNVYDSYTFLINENVQLKNYNSLSRLIEAAEDSTSVNYLDELYSITDSYGTRISLDGRRLLSSPKDCKEFFIPDGIQIVCDAAFFRRENLLDIHIPESVIYIGKSAFEHCHSLQSIVLPRHLRSVGFRSFACCYSLQKINLPKGIDVIPGYTFYYCKNLKSIEITNTISKIERRAFYGCSKLNIRFIGVNTCKIEEFLSLQDWPILSNRIETI